MSLKTYNPVFDKLWESEYRLKLLYRGSYSSDDNPSLDVMKDLLFNICNHQNFLDELIFLEELYEIFKEKIKSPILGLKWREIHPPNTLAESSASAVRPLWPNQGVKLVNAELSDALWQKMVIADKKWSNEGVKDLSTDTFIEFTQDEWNKFGVNDLSTNNFIEVTKYFQPVEPNKYVFERSHKSYEELKNIDLNDTIQELKKIHYNLASTKEMSESQLKIIFDKILQLAIPINHFLNISYVDGKRKQTIQSTKHLPMTNSVIQTLLAYKDAYNTEPYSKKSLLDRFELESKNLDVVEEGTSESEVVVVKEAVDKGQD